MTAHDENRPHLEVPAGDSLVARLERAVAPYAQRFAEAPAVRALRESLPLALVVVLLSIIGLFFHAPFRSWPVFGQQVRDFIPSAFALASLVMVLVLSYRLAVRLKLPAALVVGLALVTFAIAMPRDALAAVGEFARSRGDSGLGAFATTLGASGLFTAIVVALVTAGAIVLGRRAFGRTRGALVAALALLAVSSLLWAAHVSLAATLAAALAPLATLGDSLIALVLITGIESALWLVGIHGPALFAAIVLPVYLNLQGANMAAAALHHPLPHIVVVSTFLFVFPGGSGATLPLVLLLLRSRVRRLRTFAYAVIAPSLININEPVIFGLPVAYNPVLAVPFVVCPVVLSATTYGAMALGLVGRPALYIPSTMPTFVSTFLATLDWRASLLVAFNLVVAGAIYLPFVRVYERAEAARAARA